MFRRDPDDEPKPASGDSEPGLVPMKPFTAHGTHGTPAPLPGERIHKRTVEIPPAPKRTDVGAVLGDENTRLHIARDVRISGAITSCDRLVVDGHVEVDLPGTRILVIGTSGRYAGRATVENADISGHFEGELTVSGRLTLRSTGKVKGILRYGRITVETGGEISGEAHVLTRP